MGLIWVIYGFMLTLAQPLIMQMLHYFKHIQELLIAVEAIRETLDHLLLMK